MRIGTLEFADYCEECGSPLQFESVPCGGHSGRTGQRLCRVRATCPNHVSRGIFDLICGPSHTNGFLGYGSYGEVEDWAFSEGDVRGIQKHGNNTTREDISGRCNDIVSSDTDRVDRRRNRIAEMQKYIELHERSLFLRLLERMLDRD